MLNLDSSIVQTRRLIAIVALALLRRIASPDFLPYWKFLGKLLSPFSAKPDRGSDMSNRVIDQLEQRRLLAAEVFDVNPSPGSSSPLYTIDLNGIAIFGADDGVHGRELWRSDGTEAGTWMIKDIYPGFSDSLTNPIAVMDGVLYFTAHDGGPSLGLWKTDGTEAGTLLVTRSVQSSYSAVVAGHQLYMAVRQSSTGIELWASDGTALGTRLVKDIYPGTTSSSIGELTAAGSSIYFAADDGVHGSELWKSDGTETGTVLVQDLYPGSSASNPKYLSYYKGNLYFTFQSSSIPNQAYKIWRTDGTTTGTALFFGTGDSSFYQLKKSGDLLYFVDSGLYRTDGTTAGTYKISGTWGSYPTDVNGTLFSAASQTLFASHGTAATTGVVISIREPLNLTNVAGTLFFTAKATANSTDLWKSDGTTAGTSLVKVLDGGGPSGGFEQYAAAGGKLFFRAGDQAKGSELFSSDGTQAGTGVVKDIRTGTEDSDPIPASVVNNDLIFTTDTVRQLWKLDASNPAKVFDYTPLVWPFGIKPAGAVSINDTAVFRVSPSDPRADELWRSDGTTAGTFVLHNFSIGLSFELTPFAGKLFFVGRTTSSHHEVWTTDGTLAGTTRFLDVVPSASAVYLSGLCVSGNQLFFVVWDSNRGYDLWVTDGTVEGTRCLELPPNTISSNVGKPVAVGNDVFFSSNDGVNGTELWKSDGTPAGTVLVKDINPAGSSNPTSLVNANGTLFFLADDGVNGQELWKSDGTPAGTVRVSDIVPGSGSGTPKFLVASGSIALFTADDGVHGRELWRSDGTTSGTYMLRDIFPDSTGGLSISGLTGTGGYTYFGADDGVHGLEVWRSDGTVAGTMLIADIFAGPSDSAPSSFLAAGDSLYFAANDLEHGRELWRLSADFVPPTVQSAFDVDANPMQVSLNFSEALASPFSTADFQLLNLTTGQPIDPSMLLVSNDGLSTTIRFTTGELPDGEYRLTIPEGALHDTSGNAMSADHVLNFFVLAADANRDRLVDTQDFNLLAANFGGSSKLFSQGNFNYDTAGTVDSIDFNIFNAQYGKRLIALSVPAAGPFASAQERSRDDLDLL